MVFRRNNGGGQASHDKSCTCGQFRGTMAVAYRARTAKPLEYCGAMPQYLGSARGLQAGLELLQRQPLQIGLRGAGRTDDADLGAGGRVDGDDLDGGADRRELEIHSAG